MDDDSYCEQFGQTDAKHESKPLETVAEVEIEEEEDSDDSELQNAQGEEESGSEEEEEDEEEEENENGRRDDDVAATTALAATSSFSLPAESEADARERARLVARLRRLGGLQGFAVNDAAPLSVLRHQNWLATQQGRVDVSVKMVRRVTLLVAKACEYIARLLPDTFVNLDGYTEALTLQLDDYHELMVSLVEYYGDVITAQSPLLTYVTAIGSSMAMYSISSSFMRVKPAAAAPPRRKRALVSETDTVYETVAPAASPAAAGSSGSSGSKRKRDDDDDIMSASSSNSKQIKINL
jgi:hypothetical protein